MPTDKVLVTRDNLDLLANAIASKASVSVPMTISQMTSAVEGIQSGGTYQSKTVTPTSSIQSIVADSDYDALSQVTVNAIPSQYIVPTGTLSISSNGTYDITNYAFASVQTIDVSKKIIERTISGEYTNGDISYVGAYAFAYCKSLSKVNLPNCESTGTYAFVGCSSLTEVSCPECSSIGQYAFSSCSFLKTAYFPKATTFSWAFTNASRLSSLTLPWSEITTIPQYAVQGCTSLSYFYAPNASIIYGSAFRSCGIIDANFPNCKQFGVTASSPEGYTFYSCLSLRSVSLPAFNGAIGACAFQACYSLSDVYIPGATKIMASAFYMCYSLKSVYFPSLGSGGIYNQAFLYCSSLSKVVLGISDYSYYVPIGSYAFSMCSNMTTVLLINGIFSLNYSCFFRCYRLKSLYIFGSKANFAGQNVFYSTPIAGFTSYTDGQLGSIFVPESLYSDYINDSNWNYFSGRFVSLTSSEMQDILDELIPVIPD